MKKHPLIALIEKGESQQLDFKFEIADARKIARTFVAFANRDGGTLLIGINDEGKVTGTGIQEELFMARKAQNFISPPVPFQYKKWHIEGKKVLEISIPESHEKPHFVIEKSGIHRCYIRYKDKNIHADPTWIQMQEKKNSSDNIHIRYTALEQAFLSFLEQQKEANFTQLLQALLIEEDELRNMLSDFWSLDIIRGELSGTDILYSLR